MQCNKPREQFPRCQAGHDKGSAVSEVAELMYRARMRDAMSARPARKAGEASRACLSCLVPFAFRRCALDIIGAGGNIKEVVKLFFVNRLQIPTVLFNPCLRDDQKAATKSWHGQSCILANDVHVRFVKDVLGHRLRSHRSDLAHALLELV